MNSKLLAWILIPLILLAGIGYWVYQNLEWREEEVIVGLKEEPGRNPYFALQQYLTELGLASSFSRSGAVVHELPEPHDTLFLFSAYGLTANENLWALLNWVDDGGHLVVTLEDAEHYLQGIDDHALLYEFDLSLRYDLEASKFADNIRWFEEMLEWRNCQSSDRVNVTMTDIYTQPLNIYQPGRVNLVPYNDEYLWVQEPGLQSGDLSLAQYHYGEGKVTILPDSKIFNNAYLNCYDHAYLAYLLASPTGQTHIHYTPSSPSIWLILWHYAPYTSGLFLLLVAAFLWTSMMRFGPRHAIDWRRSRSLHQHLAAAGQFYWRQNQDWIQELQQELDAQLRRRFPQFDTLTTEQQLALFRNMGKVTAADLHHAFVAFEPHNKEQLHKTLAAIKAIKEVI